ncbi:transcription-repair coupling factor [Pendulispora albinea]|uniref:Transcription-repair-coupling factor n=1 Tax=Pendulispora albinea TaxID=2741071 RepID=A0ABZ2LYD7_9BACT
MGVQNHDEADRSAIVPDHATEAPLEPILPPEGIVAARLRDVAARVADRPAGRVDVAGVKGCSGAALVSAMAHAGTKRIVYIASDLDGARRAAQDCAFLLRGAPDDARAEEAALGDVLLYASHESSPYADVNPDRRASMSRMATLFHLAHLPWRVLAIPANALVRKVVPAEAVRAATTKIVAEEELDREFLVVKLSEAGYIRVPVVEDPGSFAVRGALVDVWPPSSDAPLRIELYGDLVISIKSFDPYEQRTLKTSGKDVTFPHVWLPPAREGVLTREATARARASVVQLAESIDWPTTKTRALTEDVVSGRAFFGADGFLPAYYPELSPLVSFFGDDAVVVLEDPAAITAAVRDELERAQDDATNYGQRPHFPPSAFYIDEPSAAGELTRRRVVTLHATPVLGEATSGGLAAFAAIAEPFDLASRDHDDLARAVKMARASKGKSATLAPLVRRIRYWREHGLRVFIAARAQTQAERLTSLLHHQGISCTARLGTFDPAWLADPSGAEMAQIIVGPLSRGALLPAEGVVLVTEEEIFGARAHRRKERRATDPTRPFLEDLRNLNVGDFVVHVEHGIGRYLGLVHKEVGGHTVDLLVVEYGGGDKLYLPAYRLNQIQKYSGGENAQPKVDRLGGSTFSRTKARVQKAVRQMADELLRLYAERKAQPGHAHDPIDDDYRAFEATFPFDETPDQQRAISEVNRDLDEARPMDRLVCGDVGFGKTEIALRAAFRVAMAGKQVALLCPTTVLAQQHFRTFEARMRDYPITIASMSRFQTKKEQDETVARLKEGKVDIVIGTHRLLSKDIHFKDLGLLVVDEEQRFGVTHKERIKQIRVQVDVLTLTATPIPRTLQMAVTGLRDLSLITTPPVDRRAVRTLVTRFDEQVIREAVTRELSRGGQVFYVHNRIEGLYEKAGRLAELVPQARIAVAHGQMTKGGTAQENGALEQTMFDFVEGRYDVLAATAIVESGLDIPRANTIIIDRADLFGLAQLYQLRGRVGRSKERAYCYLVVPPPEKMSDDARARIEALERHTELGSGFQIASLDLELRGAGDLLGGEQSGNVASVGFDLFCQMLEEAVHELRGEPVVHEVDPELSFDVPSLLPEDYVSDVGVRLSLYKRLASAMDEAHVAEIAEEMEDRFGPPPDDARRLVQLMSIKTELRRLRALGCEANAQTVTLHLREDTPLDPKKILELVRSPRSPYRLTPDMRLSRRFDGQGNGLTNAEALLHDLGKCLKA